MINKGLNTLNRLRLRLFVLIVVSLAIGFIVFSFNKYNSSTLVINTKTLEKGIKYITVEGEGNDSFSRTRLEIDIDDRKPSVYATELPHIYLKSVMIPPLADFGRYEITSITLSNESISYKWDENLNCMQQSVQNNAIKREVCSENYPAIKVDNNSSIVISSIPNIIFVNEIWFRILVAIISVIGAFLGGACLWKTFGEIREDPQHYAVRVVWLFVVFLFAYQLYLICRYSVDLPNYEEWEFFEPFALPNGLSWQWLNRPVSHQRMMIFTKLMAWVNFKLFELNFVVLKIFNYTVFGCLIYVLAKFKERVLGREHFPFFPLYIIFLISPIAFEVHAASFQSGELFVLLFSVLMLIYAYRDDEHHSGTAVFYLCALFAMCSLSAGVVMVLVILTCKTVYSTAGILRRHPPRDRELRQLLLLWGLIVPTVMFLFYDFKKPETNPDWLLPNKVKFWESFLNLLSFGFGIESDYLLPCVVCLAIVVSPIILLLVDKTTRWKPTTWQVLTATFTILAVIALITIGRGNMIGSIKVSRYAIFSLLLVPLAAMSWWLAVNSTGKRYVMLGLLWGFCIATFWNDWNYGIYSDLMRDDVLNLECVEKYSNGQGSGMCEGTHFRPIGKYFDNAKKLGVRFTRQFNTTLPEKRLP